MKENQKLNQVVNQILSLEVAKGHLKWKVSDLSRKTGMSRPLIYYYLGNTKKLMLEAAFEHVTNEFYGLRVTSKKPTGIRADKFIDGVVAAQKFLAEVPSVSIFYLKCRSGESPFNKKFIEVEKKFQKKLSLQFPDIEKHKLIGLHAILHGIVTAPFVTEESVRDAVAMVLAGYSKPTRTAAITEFT